eukprot:6648992-Prymnesium_polylepis.3
MAWMYLEEPSAGRHVDVLPANFQHDEHVNMKPAASDRLMQRTDVPAHNVVRRASSAPVVTILCAYRDRRGSK